MDKNESEITTDLLPRLDRLPWSSWHWKVWFILAGGMLLEGFVLSKVVQLFQQWKNYSALQRLRL